ncbi:MAG TPA: sugar phosphate isomerase/epimerase family protein [Steroidobacteraceae bacterium]|jgi:sugar phosphate isomerase/epimerase|nr:sugar phosphate isomerase/epimerase family protein [Steroidobacteraceae bacterium]
MRDFSKSPEWLSINTATVRRQWTLPQIIEACARHGIPAISPWRDQVAECGLNVASHLIRDTGIKLSGYCRGGMFPAADEGGLAAAMADNFRAVDEACELGSQCLVLVVGGLPGALEGRAVHRDIERSRAQVIDGIARLLEYARPRNMPLAIEPLHPMYAADRACVNTLEQALDICEALDPAATGALGVALDVYHVWWDPKLHEQIRRAGAPRLLAFHVCDWLTPTTDLLLDRGMMGDGVIDLRKIRGWMEAAGYAGFSEVEIFSANNWWQRPGDEVLTTCIERHRTVV